MQKLLIGLTALLGAASAHASIIPTLVGSPVDAGDGTFLFTYSATLASDQALETGSYFTLYDLRGFDRFGTVGAGFTASSALLGRTPSNVLPDDDGSIINATFTYSGPTVNFDGPTSERELGSFQIYSTVGTFGFEDFTSEALRNSGPSRGSLVATIGDDAISVPGGGSGNTVPEPASWAMMIAGFVMVGGTMRRRHRIAVTAS